MDNKKLQSSVEKLRQYADSFKNPVVMCSFGKDSMAMLHLIRLHRYDWPVVFFREQSFPKKYDFANKVISDWDLTVYDYPARFRSVLTKNDGIEVVSHYPFGAQEILVPTGLYEPEDMRKEKFLCSKNDVLLKPVGNFNVPWDAVIVGHKDSDTDPLQGSLKLHLDQKQTIGCPTMVFPLRDWTDADIWEYSEEYGVPIHLDRYEKIDGKWGEKVDRSLNPDWFPACSRCINAGGSEYVHCPKIGGMINNIGKQLPATQVPTYYGNS